MSNTAAAKLESYNSGALTKAVSTNDRRQHRDRVSLMRFCYMTFAAQST